MAQRNHDKFLSTSQESVVLSTLTYRVSSSQVQQLIEIDFLLPFSVQTVSIRLESPSTSVTTFQQEEGGSNPEEKNAKYHA